MKTFTRTPFSPTVAQAIERLSASECADVQTLIAAVQEQQWLKESAMRRSCELLNASAKPYGVLHITNVDRAAFAAVEKPV